MQIKTSLALSIYCACVSSLLTLLKGVWEVTKGCSRRHSLAETCSRTFIVCSLFCPQAQGLPAASQNKIHSSTFCGFFTALQTPPIDLFWFLLR